jgi:hypothetical protein
MCYCATALSTRATGGVDYSLTYNFGGTDILVHGRTVTLLWGPSREAMTPDRQSADYAGVDSASRCDTLKGGIRFGFGWRSL